MKKPKSMPIYMSMREYSWGMRYTLFQMFFLPYLLSIVWDMIMPEGLNAERNFAFYLINFAVLVPLLHNYLHQSVDHFLKSAVKIILTAIIGFGIYYVATWALSLLIQWIMPEFYNVNDMSIADKAQDHYLLATMGTVVLVPTAEELMYRGLVYGLCRKRSRVLAFAVSAAIFAAIHVVSYIGAVEPLHLLLCFLQYIPAGLVLAGAYEYSGNIFSPILIHTTVNLIAILSMR